MNTLILTGAMQVVVGTILNAGTPCPDLRLEDGAVIAVSGVPSHVRTGDRIRIEGRTRHSLSCQKEVFAAREVTVLSPAREDAPPLR